VEFLDVSKCAFWPTLHPILEYSIVFFSSIMINYP
jgi:hypothetical protein